MQIYGGGWDTELSGIWIGKYEASRTDSEGTKQGTSTIIKVQPNVTSWREITIGDAYEASLNYLQSLKSHMLKNSEWGAVAYLTYSKYGRNGTEVTINNNSNYLTGNAGDSIFAEASETTNEYNTEKGVLASSTGNVYGIYDLSGGATEYTAAYYKDGSVDLSNGLFANGINDAYSTKYDNDIGINGDATQETFVLNNGASDFVNSILPFFCHGGSCNSKRRAGIFSYFSGDGIGSNYISFRLCLIV